jgi:hypothetical protein
MLETCPVCKRVYWANSTCDHGGQKIVRPSVIKDEPELVEPPEHRIPPKDAAKGLLDDLEGG